MTEDFKKLLELLGFQKLSPEKQEQVKQLLNKLIDHYQGDDEDEKIDDGVQYLFQEMNLDTLDETAQAEIREHLWKCIKQSAGYHLKENYDFNFGSGFSNSLKGNMREQMTTGDNFEGPDSNRIGDIYKRTKDTQGIFRHEPKPKPQDEEEKKIEKQLQKIKDLFQNRNIKDVSIADIEKIISESSPTTSTFSHNAWSGFKYIKVNKTGLVVHSNTFLCQAGTKLTSQKQAELEAQDVKIYFNESLNEGTQNKNELIKALANLLEWAKGNRGSKSGNPYGFPEVKRALEVLGKIEGVNYMDVDTKKLSEALLSEAFQSSDSIMDDLTYSELLDTVYSNIEDPDEKAVMREFNNLVKAKVNDAKYEMRKVVKQILKDIQND